MPAHAGRHRRVREDLTVSRATIESNAWEQLAASVARIAGDIRYGTVEITIHDARVVQLEVSDAPVLDGVHEVVVRVTATAKLKDKVLFLVEGKQGGIFEMRNLPAEQMGAILGVVCPSIIYPYLRSNIADLITRTGLPPVHLAEVNFEAFYNQKQAALAQQKGDVPLPENESATPGPVVKIVGKSRRYQVREGAF